MKRVSELNCFADGRRFAWYVIAAFISLLPAALPAGAKSIFDDDWTPPTSPAAPSATTRPVPGAAVPAPSPSAVPKVVPLGVYPASPAIPTAPASRRPVPAAADQNKSRTLMRVAFSTELQDASPAARRALAEKLLEEAAKVPDTPADQFVLIGGAIQSAVEAADLPLAFRGADMMADAFELDGLAVKAGAALKLPAKAYAATPENVAAGSELLDELESAEHFPAAARLVVILEQAPAVDPSPRAGLPQRAREIEELRAARDRLAPALQKLKTVPNDPAANLAVGRYTALLLGDWERGLPLLAKGDDAKLAALAKAARANPTDAGGHAALADGCWEIAQTSTGRIKTTLLAQSADDYRVAMPGLSGLGRVLAERRIAEATAAVGPARRHVARSAPAGLLPGLVAELYLDTDFARLIVKRIDRQIYFEWQDAGPDRDIKGGRFSIRWTGALRVPRSGTYTFFASVDDEVEIWIDGQSVLAQHEPSRSARGEAKLSDGLHQLRIDYRNTGGEGRIMLQWAQENGFAQQSLGRDVLWHEAGAGGDAEPALPGWRSNLISGAHGGESFREEAAAHSVLVGFELCQHHQEGADVVKSARAIYRGPSGDVLGKLRGDADGEVTRLVAKPGYAVGAIHAHGGSHVDGFSLQFMRLSGDTLLPADSYDSEYFGGPGGDKIDVGEGKPIVGIYGVSGSNLDGLGVLMLDAAAPTPAVAAVMPTSLPAAPARATIVSADYGNDAGMVSIVKEIQAALDADPFMPIDPGNAWAGDPSPGSGKTLTLSYRLGEKTCNATVSENHICFVPRIPEGGIALPGASVPFKIIAARYGADNAWVDATEAIRAEVQNPAMPYKVHNMAGGKDVRFGKEKRLVVYYETEGRRFVKITREGSEMTLAVKE